MNEIQNTFFLEKHKAQSKAIYKLIDNDKEIKTSEEIVNIASSYFNKIYSKQNSERLRQNKS